MLLGTFLGSRSHEEGGRLPKESLIPIYSRMWHTKEVEDSNVKKFPQDEVSNMAVADSQTASQAGPSKLAEASSSSPAAVFKRLHPAQYLSRFLVQGYRPDGRETRAWRDVSVNAGMSAYFLHMASYYSYFTGNLPTEITGSISTADGSALVRMGDTTMVCGIKAEIAEPDMTRPNEGFLSEYLSSKAVSHLPQLNCLNSTASTQLRRCKISRQS